MYCAEHVIIEKNQYHEKDYDCVIYQPDADRMIDAEI